MTKTDQCQRARRTRVGLATSRELNEVSGSDVADVSLQIDRDDLSGRTPQTIRQPLCGLGTVTERNRNLSSVAGRQHWLADRPMGGKHRPAERPPLSATEWIVGYQIAPEGMRSGCTFQIGARFCARGSTARSGADACRSTGERWSERSHIGGAAREFSIDFPATRRRRLKSYRNELLLRTHGSMSTILSTEPDLISPRSTTRSRSTGRPAGTSAHMSAVPQRMRPAASRARIEHRARGGSRPHRG